MKRFHYILREIFRFRGNALIRLISLVLGLGVAVLLFTYDAFQLSFDTFSRRVTGSIGLACGLGSWKVRNRTSLLIPISLLRLR